MEEPIISWQEEDDGEEFHDALDDFEFFDCDETFYDDPIESNGAESISDPDPYQSPEENSPPPAVLRRRTSRSNETPFGAESTESANFSSSESVDDYLREKKVPRSRKLKEYEKVLEDSKGVSQKNEMSEEKSTVTDANAVACDDESNSRRTDESNSCILFSLAGIVIKPISFQIHLIVKLFMFTIRLVYYSYMIVFNPLGLLMLCRRCFIQKMKNIWNLVFGIVSEYVYEWLKEQRAIWKLGLKCGWGLLWSAYVCAVLGGLLVSAFLMGGILIKVVVEEPIRLTRGLNFDYSEKSPEAFVPIMSNVKMNRDVMHLVEKPEVLKTDGSRVVPRDHGVQVTVSLTVPESEYNQHLGIFQVRVDFLSADGQILTTSRSPCMLQYRSQSIQLLLTLLKVAPILTGYTSETQNLKVSFRDFTEGEIPTACLRVVLEQRAEYSTGAGIPEIYSASLLLESELPLQKRILWFWKKTLFVWVSMAIFMLELAFALLCCRPFIIPKIRLWSDANHNNHPRS